MTVQGVKTMLSLNEKRVLQRNYINVVKSNQYMVAVGKQSMLIKHPMFIYLIIKKVKKIKNPILLVN